MLPFSYNYKSETLHSKAKPYVHNGDLRYLVILPNGTEVGIAPLTYPDVHDKILWTQATKLDDMILPYDLVQAIGKGLEQSQS
jgi:hypothetical protein